MNHNDYDINCVNWYGDRSPARNRNWRGKWKKVPSAYRWFGGDVMMLNDHRCLVCNPYSEADADNLLGY